ncbi:hypothetical protein VB773_13585 [Haloarculaceae archaeon H-GB2-1]|nr:hypothetical protein [Haloarculaceae archaeon H-GB11]MEA5408496.1 hypothetical protein [Haloarculaceae archaeon H-GB2-1]
MDGFGAAGDRWPSKPELAVFVSGVASMGLEILAGRMIAPQFGSSIYTWGASSASSWPHSATATTAAGRTRP